MKTLSVPVHNQQSCPQQSNWRRGGLWIAFAVAMLLAVAVSFVGWGGAAKALPYALILACPAMHLFMCRKDKSSQASGQRPPGDVPNDPRVTNS